MSSIIPALKPDSSTKSRNIQPEEVECESKKTAAGAKSNLTCVPKKYTDQMGKYGANTGFDSPKGPAGNDNISENMMSNPPFDPRKMDALSKHVANVSSGNHHHRQPTPAPPNAKTNHGHTTSNRSDSLESSTASFKPHTGGDVRWDAINMVNAKDAIGLSSFRLLRRLGYGDIGSVYLVELRGTSAHFAMKVMDKASLASRNKLLRAQTEREILGLLDHPFLPTFILILRLISSIAWSWSSVVEAIFILFARGNPTSILLRKQPGIVYRDLKPENVLVRNEGHIMLSDFDLSLRCSVNPTLVKSSSANVSNGGGNGGGGILDDEFAVHGCMQPSTFFPRILPSKKNHKSKSDFSLFVGGSLPELMAEPTNVRSMSFVGTHEYLAPEIIRGEGHGSAVDWWTFGIFLYELLHGTTPFKGSGNRATLFNVVGQPLRFPDTPQVSFGARDLIRGLLVKEPHKRIACKRGATEIKQHPFFEGVNWALVRSAMPPHVPEPVDFSQYASKEPPPAADNKMADSGVDKNNGSPHHHDSSYIEFEYF
ncbi:hypothetical protein GH714_032394 [Hevea brasiliensis]|uniref:non-specific serine/threonine protein kinase n=1 Tax=Hevea brasiliensis TaxID=3981 RepID=A0A6A6KDJ3_HEVBR|nr:hypothetical protein GH714_032394 [Hevea brasiliensis]